MSNRRKEDNDYDQFHHDGDIPDFMIKILGAGLYFFPIGGKNSPLLKIIQTLKMVTLNLNTLNNLYDIVL